MEVETILKILVLVIGFYMAWNIGANDVSNAMGTSVGSGALTIKKAVILAAILEFSGAFFVGAPVTKTMQRGLIDTDMFIAEPMVLILGMCAALLGTGIWLQIASYSGWPVSTTHAIVGAILGFGGVIGGIDAIHWEEVSFIGLSWIISPVSSGILSYFLFHILQRKILFAMNPTEATKKLMPLMMFIIFGTFTLSLIFNGLENLHLNLSFPQAFLVAVLVGSLAAAIGFFLVNRMIPAADTGNQPRQTPQNVVSLEKAIKHLQRVAISSFDETHDRTNKILNDVKALTQEVRKETSIVQKSSEYKVMERMFVYLQILSACFVAFAHGANDVSNAIGPVAAAWDILKNGVISETAAIPPWLLAFGGIGIVIGLATWGWRVIETIGKKITELTPTRGFCAEFGAATTILIASKLGLPVSTTHCLVGSVLGVGAAGGIRALNLSTVKDIIISWIITIPASATMSIIIFYILRAIFI